MIYTPSELEKLYARRSKYATEFGKIVAHLERESIIRNVVQVGDIAYCVKPNPRFPFSAICREAAGQTQSGFFADIGENSGLRWQMGNAVGGILLPHSAREEIKAAQDIVSRVIPAHERPPLAWTNGGNARQLVRWVIEKEIKHVGEAEDLLTPAIPGEDVGERAYQYHDCKPGKYAGLVMYDAEAFYFNLISRAKALRLSVYPSKNGSKPAICWGEWQGQEYEKWREVIAHIGETKLLRNALWGVLLGSSGNRFIYTSAAKKEARMTYETGVWQTVPASPAGRIRQEEVHFAGGMARALALLVGRGGAEICAEASSEVSSVYSTLDSVTVTNGAVPKTWKSLGLPSGIKEKGMGNIVARGVWQIGPNHTADYYDKGKIIPARYECPAPPSPVERRFYTSPYYKLWLL